MNTAEYKHTSVDITGLLKVLGENLYSRPEVAVRELIQNASDAINRRKLQGDKDFAPRIDVECRAGENTLIITDNGSGLTADEIEQFLARIGSGFTRSLRKETSGDQLIGAFGLGFLTAYMIGQRVEVRTTSMTGSACRFVSENGQRYIVSPMTPGQTGSQVIIHLKDTYEHLASPEGLRNVAEEYCRLMEVDIYLQGADRPINIAPPWRYAAANEPEIRLQKRRRDFALQIEPAFEPLCTIPVKTPTGNGLLWIHDRTTYGGADNRWMQIYIRGMMVARNKHDFLPAWASFVSGIIDCTDLNPTASREDIIQDPAYNAAKSAAIDALNAGIADIARTQPETWRVILRRHNEALLGAAISDDALFAAIQHDVTLPTSEGDLTLPDITARSPSGLAIALHADSGADEIVSRALGTPVILGYRYGAAAFTHKYAAQKGLGIIELGTQQGNALLFPKQDPSGDMGAKIKALFGRDDMTLRLSEFEPDFLNCLCFVDAEQSLKAYYESDEADKSISSGALSLARAFTKKIDKSTPLHLVINLRSPLIKSLVTLPPDLSGGIAKSLIANARMLCRHKALGQNGFAASLGDMNAGFLEIIAAQQTANGDGNER